MLPNAMFLRCSNEMKINLTSTRPFLKIRVLNVRKENVSVCLLFHLDLAISRNILLKTLDETEFDSFTTPALLLSSKFTKIRDIAPKCLQHVVSNVMNKNSQRRNENSTRTHVIEGSKHPHVVSCMWCTASWGD